MNEDSLAMTGKRTAGVTRRGALVARAGRLWRKLGTGFCFVVYGATGWVAGLIVLPVLMFWPGTAAQRRRRIRNAISASFRWLLALIAGLRVGYVHIEGRQWLDQAEGKLLVANHPMYLDVLALISVLPQADCVIKHAMWKNRLYHRFVAASGYISNADSASLVHDCVAALREGQSLVLFPEATRSTPGEPLHFYRGAAQVAVRSGCEVLPVVIRCEPLGLGKGQKWHDVADRPWRLSLRICPPQSLAELDWREGMPHGVAARHVTRAMQAFFEQALGGREAPATVPATHEAEVSAPLLVDAAEGS